MCITIAMMIESQKFIIGGNGCAKQVRVELEIQNWNAYQSIDTCPSKVKDRRVAKKTYDTIKKDLITKRKSNVFFWSEFPLNPKK